MTPYYDVWKARMGLPPVGEMARFLRPLDKEFGPEAVERALGNYLDEAGKFVSLARFAHTFKMWAPHLSLTDNRCVNHPAEFAVATVSRRPLCRSCFEAL